MPEDAEYNRHFADDYHQLEPCVILIEPKGDRVHWVHQHEPIQVVHRLNPLLTGDHSDPVGRIEEDTVAPLGMLERLDADVIWCEECFDEDRSRGRTDGGQEEGEGAAPVCHGGAYEEHHPTEMYETSDIPDADGTVFRCSNCRALVEVDDGE